MVQMHVEDLKYCNKESPVFKQRGNEEVLPLGDLLCELTKNILLSITLMPRWGVAVKIMRIKCQMVRMSAKMLIKLCPFQVSAGGPWRRTMI